MLELNTSVHVSKPNMVRPASLLMVTVTVPLGLSDSRTKNSCVCVGGWVAVRERGWVGVGALACVSITGPKHAVENSRQGGLE